MDPITDDNFGFRTWKITDNPQQSVQPGRNSVIQNRELQLAWRQTRQSVFSGYEEGEMAARPVFILLIRTGLAVCGLWGDKCCPDTSPATNTTTSLLWSALYHTGRDWERLRETGRDWERLGETGRDCVPTSGVVKHGLCCTNRILDTCEVSSYPASYPGVLHHNL